MTSCSNCESNEIYQIDGYQTCTDCGCMDINRPQLVHEYAIAKRVQFKPVIIYHRCNYFTELLQCMTIRKSCHDLPIKVVISNLKKKPKQTIKQIKQYLKQSNLQKYNKYIYYIYYQLYGVNLINVTNKQYNRIIHDFKTYDRTFRLTNKRNQLNYQFIIYKLFTKRGIPTDHIIIPKTVQKLEATFNLL